MFLRTRLVTAALALIAATPTSAAADTIELKLLGRYATGVFDESAAEIPAYDAATRRLFVVNGFDRTLDVLDISDPSNPVKTGAIAVSDIGAAANSVASFGGVIAAAIEANEKTDRGFVTFYNAATLKLISRVRVGALPDMLTFTPDGRHVLVANEGEPNDDYTIDPEGSVSVIDVRDIRHPSVRTADFRRFDTPARKQALVDQGVRIFGPGARVAQDLEPEYIAVAPTGNQAYVTLQENNAIALIDVDRARIVEIRALGSKDHSLPGNGLDPSDEDGGPAIAKWPVQGMAMPDAIAAFGIAGERYLITANEGDARDYDGFSEEARVEDLVLDATAFPNAAELQAAGALGRLNVTTAQGDTDGDGDFDHLYSFGARSFTIWKADGTRVYDSGDLIERMVLARHPEFFNADNTNNDLDDRSDNKGPEPEGVAVARIDGRTLAFIGLERIGGVMVVDVSVPSVPKLLTYFNPRDFTAAPDSAAAGDLGPEGLIVIDAADSPNGRPLLVVANEVSGSTSIIEIGYKDVLR